MTDTTPEDHAAPVVEPQADKGAPTAQTSRNRKRAFIILGAVFLIIGLIWLIYWLIIGRFHVYTDDAYVNGNLVQLMSQVPGTVIKINTDDTYLVKQGQPIILLDPSDMQIALKSAHASLALTVRQISQAFERAKQAQATLKLRAADLVKAQLDLKRRLGLIGDKAVSREELQHYKTSVENAQAQYDFALHSLRSALAIVQNSHLYTHPQVERAKENYKIAYLNLIRTTIVAPITGFVAKRNIQIGQRIAVNTPMLAIIPLDNLWVDANYKESQLSDLRIGQPVTLRADAYSDVTYHGKILGLNAGTGAAFALLPAQNATGNWIKIVQRLPVRISLNPEELKQYPLQIGLSMRVTADIHNLRGNRLPTQPIQQPVYSTAVYASQLAEVQKIIDKILRDNSPDMSLSKQL